MLADYRAWLESELKLLGNASHHAYSFGQANMAKRALERLDVELAATLFVEIDKAAARDALTGLEAFAQQSTQLSPALMKVRDALRRAIAQGEPPAT